MADSAQSLHQSMLPDIASRVQVPSYDRQQLQPSIIHLGVGGFHRAHQAVYLDDLAGMGGKWGERGIGLLPQDRGMAEALVPQGGLYTLVVRSAEGDRARVIGSMVDYLLAPDGPE